MRLALILMFVACALVWGGVPGEAEEDSGNDNSRVGFVNTARKALAWAESEEGSRGAPYFGSVKLAEDGRAHIYLNTGTKPGTPILVQLRIVSDAAIRAGYSENGGNPKEKVLLDDHSVGLHPMAVTTMSVRLDVGTGITVVAGEDGGHVAWLITSIDRITD